MTQSTTLPAHLPLADWITVRPRFLRSVNLERDFHAPQPLHGYILTATAASALERIAQGLEHVPARAWSVTGAYGSGKSAFALFAAKSLATPALGAEAARAQALRQQSALDPQIFGAAQQGLWPILVTGGREPLARALVRGVRAALESLPVPQAATVLRKLEGQCGATLAADNPTAREVAELYAAASRLACRSDKSCRGLLLVIDELGKFLEYAALHPEQGDMQVLQELAEYAARSESAPLLLVTILHQAFEEYAHRLSATQRVEWQKVQGRFADIPFGDGVEDTIRLIAQAVEHDVAAPVHDAAWERLKQAAERVRDTSYFLKLVPAALQPRDEWGDICQAAYPLHPLTLLVLPTLFRRFGQSERSLFSFLSSAEPHGFADFLKTHQLTSEHAPWLCPDHLYDYMMAALGSTLYAHSGARLWSEIEEALFRLRDGDPLQRRLVKTIGLLHIVGESARVQPSHDVLRFALEDEHTSHEDIDAALDTLRQAQLIVHRQFKGAYRLYEGSDVDIEARLRENRAHFAPSVDVVRAANRIEAVPPIVARRHSYETGTLRFFEVRACRPAALEQEIWREPAPTTGADGVLLLCLAANAAELEAAQRTAQEHTPRATNVVVGLNLETEMLREAAIAVESLLAVQEETPELQRDGVAAREVGERLAEAQRAFQTEWERLMRPQNAAQGGALWLYGGQRVALASYRQLQALLSRACDATYPATPRLLNELVNRRQLSSTAAAARRDLIQAMIEKGGQPRLGLKGYGPEVSMYVSVLQATGIHRWQSEQDGWGFDTPRHDDGLARAWSQLEHLLFTGHLQMRPLPEFFETLRGRPFGMTEGVMPILLCAILLKHGHEVALYEDGGFVIDLDAATFERMIKQPGDFALQGCRIAGERQAVLDRFATGLRLSDEKTLVDVARRIYRTFNRWPEYTLKTRRLSGPARALRDAIKAGRQPEQLLFVDLPLALGAQPFIGDVADPANSAVFFERWNAALTELQSVYDMLLAQLETALCERLGAPDWQTLRQRAASLLPTVTEPRLKAFALRAADTALQRVAWLESVVSALAQARPPAVWSDAEVERFELDLTPLVAAWQHAELLRFEKHRGRANGAPPLGAAQDQTQALRLAVTSDTGAEDARVVLVSRQDAARIDRLARQLLQNLEALVKNEPPEVRIAVLSQVAQCILRAENERGAEDEPRQFAKRTRKAA